MRLRVSVTVCIFCALLILNMNLFGAQAQNYVQYKIQLGTDGKAVWTVTQVTAINGPVDTLTDFQQKVASLIDAATNQTKRAMSLDPNSLVISTSSSSNESKIVEYMFTWLNFSVIQNTIVTFGDVFSVSNFFNQLYGDGALVISYPSTYTIKSVAPAPDVSNNSSQTLEWLGTQFFVNGSPHIELTAFSPPTTSNGNNWELPVLIGVASAAVATALAGGFMLRRRKRKTVEAAEMHKLAESFIESEEQKIVNIIQSNGGTMLQSAVTEQSRFSKAKASQLLSALEKKGIVRRYKKGRDKIVTLAERGK